MVVKTAAGQERKDPMDRENRESMEEIHLRILRITEDLRAVQRELNCVAMQAPNNPELMEALSGPPEMETIQVLKSALDQMRHFLWFYVQVMTSGVEPEERPRVSDPKKPVSAVMEKYSAATDAALLRYFADAKNRKPN